MTVDLAVLLLGVTLAGAGLSYWKWGWRGLVVASGAVLALGAVLLRRKPPAVVLPPLPPSPDEGTKAVHDEAAAIVTEHAEKEREEIRDAADDGKTLAVKIRKMK